MAHVLVVAWAQVPYGHSCDVLPEGIRHNCANKAHMVTGKAQATTNLLPVPGKVPSVARNTMH